jgi:hypothetical protein
MKDISRIAAAARSSGMSYGRFVASGRAEPQEGRADPVCAECPQCSQYSTAEGQARFCHYMNRPIEAHIQTSPDWCWLRSLRNT